MKKAGAGKPIRDAATVRGASTVFMARNDRVDMHFTESRSDVSLTCDD